MRRIRILFVAWFSALGLALSATAAADGPLRVVATFTILSDLAEQVAGDRAQVQVLTPAGAEVHEWELQARNFVALERADVVLANGYGLEQWMGQVRATIREGVPVVPVAEQSGYETRSIITGEQKGRPDPHLWMDVRAARAYVEVIADVLSEYDPDGASVYRDNADAFNERLAELHETLEARLGAIPDSQRTLITSEAAFIYFANAYGFVHDGVWGTNAEEEGTPRQLMRIVDQVREKRPRAVFWESTISDRHVRTVAEETGVEVAGPLYVDSIGIADSGASSYIDMMNANADLLVRLLGEGVD